MIFSYYDTAPYYGEMDLELAALWYILYIGGMSLAALAAYILQSLSLFQVAKRRCIQKPWLAWIPVGNLWILGSIADQYRYVALGQVKNKRKALLVLEILVALAGAVITVLCVVLIAQLISFGVGNQIGTDMLGTVAGMVIAALMISGTKIASMVIQYMADYDYYRSSEPGNAVLYLVLSIFFSITRPVFLFLCSKKDGGMPPRKQDPVDTIPVQEPWETTAEE